MPTDAVPASGAERASEGRASPSDSKLARLLETETRLERRVAEAASREQRLAPDLEAQIARTRSILDERERDELVTWLERERPAAGFEIEGPASEAAGMRMMAIEGMGYAGTVSASESDLVYRLDPNCGNGLTGEGDSCFPWRHEGARCGRLYARSQNTPTTTLPAPHVPISPAHAWPPACAKRRSMAPISAA